MLKTPAAQPRPWFLSSVALRRGSARPREANGGRVQRLLRRESPQGPVKTQASAAPVCTWRRSFRSLRAALLARSLTTHATLKTRNGIESELRPWARFTILSPEKSHRFCSAPKTQAPLCTSGAPTYHFKADQRAALHSPTGQFR